MDPLSVTAAVVGIAAPIAHYVRLFIEDIQKIVDTPETLNSLREDLLSMEQTLASLQTVSHTQWKSLGETMVNQSKVTTAKEAEIAGSITASDKQLAEANAKLRALRLAKTEQDETEADRVSAISQVAVEQTALGESRKLLEELLSGIHTAAADARNGQARVVNNFGNLNEGMQIGEFHGTMSGIIFGKK